LTKTTLILKLIIMSSRRRVIVK